MIHHSFFRNSCFKLVLLSSKNVGRQWWKPPNRSDTSFFFSGIHVSNKYCGNKKMLDDSGENMKKIWSIVALSDGGQHQPTAGLDQKENKRCWLYFFVGIFIPCPLIFICALVTPYFGSFLGPLLAPTFQMLRIVLGRIVSLNYVGSKVRYQRHIWLALVIKSHYTAKFWCACVRLLIFSLVPWFVITRKRSREKIIFVLGVSHFLFFFSRRQHRVNKKWWKDKNCIT